MNLRKLLGTPLAIGGLALGSATTRGLLCNRCAGTICAHTLARPPFPIREQKNGQVYARDIERIVDTVFEQISLALTRGDLLAP